MKSRPHASLALSLRPIFGRVLVYLKTVLALTFFIKAVFSGKSETILKKFEKPISSIFEE
jgi:hypothetical protein